MKRYIFLTREGTACEPGDEVPGPDIDNLQVIGFASGNSPQDAAQNLIKEATYLKETAFNEITALELKSQKQTVHYLKKPAVA